jgi:MFS family permease
MYYGPKILITAGVHVNGLDEEQAALLLNIPLTAMVGIGSVLAVWFIERFGRRTLMLWSLPPQAACLCLVSLGMYLSREEAENPDVGTYLAFSAILIFLLAFGIGMSSTVWAINAEIYPIHVIGTATALATATNWTFNYMVAQVFPLALNSTEGSILAFASLGICCMLGYIFIYCLVPETANKEITEILKEILGEEYLLERP